MALQDRSNGSNFKTKGSGDSFSKPYSSTGGEVTPPVTNRLLRYALDQSTLIQRFMSHHMPMGWMLLPIEKYSSIQVSSDRKKYTIELDLDDTEYSDFAGFKQTNIPYLVILEAVNLEDSVIQGMVNNTLPFAELAFETDNTNSSAWDGSDLSEIMFNYLGKWYFAISRTAFRSVSGFRTLVTPYITIGDNTQYATANLSEYISIKDSNEEELGDFDYAVIRYIWTASNGKDLDTRTRITTPPRNVDVGWSRSQNDLTYLAWGGDNTLDGVEAVLIDVKSLIANYVDIPEFIIALRAFWFSSVANGGVKIEFESYKGGTMQKQGYNFVNVGGVSIQTLNINNKTFVHQSSNLDGEQLATIYFNPTTKTGRLVIEETGNPPVIEFVAFNNFRLADDPSNGNVKVTFNNPSSNSSANAKLTVWRRTTPFNGSPVHDDWWEDLPKPVSGDNLYTAGGDAGQTVYYAFALTNPADNTAILNPVAYVTVVFPEPIGEDYAPVSNVVITVEDI